MLIYDFIERAKPDSTLIVLVHGRAGNVQVMRAFKNVLPKDLNVISVQAPLSDPEGGFRWWEFKSGSELLDNLANGALKATKAFEDWLAQVLIKENLNPSKKIAIGFSQGAALISILIQTNPDLFSAVALLAGFLVEVDTIEALAKSSKPKVFMFHGSEDKIVPYQMAIDAFEKLKGKGFDVEFKSEASGHKVGIEGMKSLKSWLLSNC